jgi:hypothetical protein
MTKRYETVVLAIGPVEGGVLLLVKSLEIECFASYCPSTIEVGETYEVEFELVLPDNDVVAAAEEPLTTLIEMTNNGFSCALYGYLDGDVFRSFVDFSDQDIHYDLPHLNGRFVKIQVDRIDVFLMEIA